MVKKKEEFPTIKIDKEFRLSIEVTRKATNIVLQNYVPKEEQFGGKSKLSRGGKPEMHWINLSYHGNIPLALKEYCLKSLETSKDIKDLLSGMADLQSMFDKLSNTTLALNKPI